MFQYFWLSFQIIFPILFFMGVGLILKKIQLLDVKDFTKLNRLVFKVFLPVKLFMEVYKSDFAASFLPQVVGYAVFVVFAEFFLSWFVAGRVTRESRDLTVLAQGMSRSNYVLFGMAIAASMYPGRELGIISVLAAFIVPIFNILAVFLYEFYRGGDGFRLGKVLKGILHNNLVLGSVLGMAFMALGIRLPDLIMKPLEDMADISTPLAVICVGATLSFGTLKKYARYISIAVLGRLIVGPLLFTTGAVLLGIRGLELAGIFLITATPTATASFPMAKELGGNDELAGLIVAVNNIVCLFTLFIWIVVLMQFGLL